MMGAVVFDMDGVLFDTERLGMESWLAIADRHGFSDMETFYPSCIGRNNADTKALTLEFYGADFDYDTFRKEASAYFHAFVAQNGLPVKEGVCELLTFLKEQKWQIALASSSNYKSVIAHLEQTGLKEYFSAIVTGDMVEHSKPEPDIYLIACKKIGVSPEDAFAIEDSPNGIRAAHRAGMRPIMVPDLVAADEEMERLCHKIFPSLIDVKAYLSTFPQSSATGQQ